MTSALTIATIAIACAAGRPMSTDIDMPLVRPASSVALTYAAAQDAADVLNGKWQGTTVSGHQLVLQLQVQGQRLKGRLTVGKQSANILEGKVVGDTFALTTGPIDGHKVGGTGRHTGDAIELTIDGVKEPLTLTRVK